MLLEYEKIYYYIKEKIKNKEIKPSDKIESERELMKKFNLSRTTVRTALSKLEKENLIYKIHGKGNFVSNQIIKQELNSFYSFHEKIKSLGKNPSSKIISFTITEANEFLSEVFNIPINSKLYTIKRLRLIDNDPVMLETTYLPCYRFKNFDIYELNSVSMYEIFKTKYDVNFEKAIENFKPIFASKKEDLINLNLRKNDILMKIERFTFENSKIIEYTISHLKHDIFEYSVILNFK